MPLARHPGHPGRTACYFPPRRSVGLHAPTLLLGGPHVTFVPEEALEHGDLVVRGEGEGAMNALLDLWNAGPVAATDPRHAAVPNLSWKDGAGVIHHNDKAPWITDLDALPVPDFSLAGGTADCVIGGKKTVKPRDR